MAFELTDSTVRLFALRTGKGLAFLMIEIISVVPELTAFGRTPQSFRNNQLTTAHPKPFSLVFLTLAPEVSVHLFLGQTRGIYSSQAVSLTVKQVSVTTVRVRTFNWDFIRVKAVLDVLKVALSVNDGLTAPDLVAGIALQIVITNKAG